MIYIPVDNKKKTNRKSKDKPKWNTIQLYIDLRIHSLINWMQINKKKKLWTCSFPLNSNVAEFY